MNKTYYTMKPKLHLTILFILLTYGLCAQKVIKERSKSMRVSMQPHYEFKGPPMLTAEISFKEHNNNNFLEALEKAQLSIKIKNIGQGPAQGVFLNVIDSIYRVEQDLMKELKALGLEINDYYLYSNESPLLYFDREIPFIYPGDSVEIDIDFVAGLNIKTAKHRLFITTTERFGFDMNTNYVEFYTIEYQKPKLEFYHLEIVDYGEGTQSIGKFDNMLQPGEKVRVKITIQNNGNNIAENVQYTVTRTDNNIILDDKDRKGNLGNIHQGHQKEFWLSLTVNNRVKESEKLPIFLSVTHKFDKGGLKDFNLPIAINQKPPAPIAHTRESNLASLSNLYQPRYGNQPPPSNTQDELINIHEVRKTNAFRKNSVAVIIGIEKHAYLPFNVPYAMNDARLIEKYFRDVLGIENVMLRLNEQATGNNLKNLFDPEFRHGLSQYIVKGETDLFIYYAGHGFRDNDGRDAYLFPHDAIFERLSEQGLSMDKFYSNIHKLGARSVNIFMDACFSGHTRSTQMIAEAIPGGGTRSLMVAPKHYKPWETDSSFSVFSSASYDERAIGYDDSQTGLFTYFLCAGLQGHADKNNDGIITNEELFDYIRVNLPRKFRQLRRNESINQTPQFVGDKDFILVK